MIAFSETWCGEVSENWEADDGHTWLGSVGDDGQNGVGFCYTFVGSFRDSHLIRVDLPP